MGPRKWQRRCIWLIAFPLFHVEAKRAAAFIEDAFEVESLSSYVVFLQTRLHSEPPRTEASRKPSGGALANGSAELRSMTIPKRPSHSSQHSAVAGAGVHPASHNASQALVHTGNHSNISKQTSSSNTLVNKTVSSPTLGDYIKALAALAAETTASVGDALGETADDDSQNATDEGQDEALGTSAAVGATIGVVVGATVGVN
mmetsp:Transcript_100957/g.240588  ORF Transcript_100957/g.240588 Transcript_100957/m.240588 type:complete len:202 (+) Transcript_100957:51-656(+)